MLSSMRSHVSITRSVSVTLLACVAHIHTVLQNVETKQGFAQNKLITTAIKAQWFADVGAPGVKYSSQFSPLREVTIAFIFTTVSAFLNGSALYMYINVLTVSQIEFCLDQWASGHYDKNLTYSDKVYRAKYAAHLKHVCDWCEIDHDGTRTIRQRMYDRARSETCSLSLSGVQFRLILPFLVGDRREHHRR